MRTSNKRIETRLDVSGHAWNPHSHVGILAHFQAAQMQGVAQPVGEHRSIRCPHVSNICCAISRLSSAINRLLALRTRMCVHVLNVHAAWYITAYTHATSVRPSVVAIICCVDPRCGTTIKGREKHRPTPKKKPKRMLSYNRSFQLRSIV